MSSIFLTQSGEWLGRGREHACARVEADGVVSMLCILPKLYVAVIEHIGIQVHVVETLRREHHPNIITSIEEWQGLIEELDICNLHRQQYSSLIAELVTLLYVLSL